MNPDVTPCGGCGHTLHRAAESTSPCCAFPGCDCAGWKRPQCPGSLGAAVPGACPGQPFVGGHDPGCPDAESRVHGARPLDGSQAPQISYSIDAAAGIVRLVYQGGPSFEQWRRTTETALADPAYRTGFSFLVDRRLDDAPSPEFVRRVLQFLWLRVSDLAGSRWAIVTRAPASYGMARVLKALGSDHPMPIEVFMDMKEAERWLQSKDAG